MTAMPNLADLRSEAIAKANARLREIEENKKLYDADVERFAADCLTIRPKEGSDVLFRFNAVQRRLHQELEEQRRNTGKVRALVLKARQPGVSTYAGARFYHRVSRNRGLRAFILTHEQAATDNVFEMVQRYHDHNPHAPHTGASNAKELYFDQLDSGFAVGTAGSKGIGRSFTFQLFHGSEVAFWQNAADHAAGALQAVPNAPNTEIILESTANGMGGLFYNMCMAAMRGIGDYILVFIPWFEHHEYQIKPKKDWSPPTEFAEYAELHDLSVEQLYWAFMKNAELAAAEGEPADKICWKFRQEYPATAKEAFRASRQGSFISGEDVQKARSFTAPSQDHAPIVLGVDLATGGGGEGGDDNVIIDRQARAAGRHVYKRWNDKDAVSVASTLAQVIDEVKPSMTFIDTGGGGAEVHDILKARGYTQITLVAFGGKAIDDRKYSNKRAEIWGECRAWLKDAGGADIPDEDLLDSELTSPKAKTDFNDRIVIEKKEKVRKDLGHSPDGADALCCTFAETIHEVSMEKIDPFSGRGRSSPLGYMGN